LSNNDSCIYRHEFSTRLIRNLTSTILLIPHSYLQYITTLIADVFAVERTRARSQGAAIVLRVSAIYEDGVDAPGTQREIELGMRASIEAARRDDLVARTEQGHHGDHLRSHTRSR